MAQREHLIPVTTVDRNGRQTTVYKRGDQPASAARALPTPKVEVRDYLRENLNLIKDMAGLETDGECRLLLSNLNSYRREFQQELHALLTMEDDVLASAIAAHVLDRDNETFIRECASFLPELDVEDLEYGAGLVASLRMHTQLPWAADYSKADDRLRAQCLSLMQAVAAVESISAGSPELHYRSNDHKGTAVAVLADSYLVDAVLEDPEQAQEITRVIREYRIGLYAPIKEIMEGNVPAMSLGAL